MAHDNPVISGDVAAPIPPAKRAHWKLIVGLAVGGFASFVLTVCGFVYIVFSMMGGSAIAREAVKKAASNPAVVKQLGSPIKMGWIVTGSMNTSGSSGDADLAIPVSGPKGKGTIYLTAHKSEGAWTYSVLDIVFDGDGEKINLLSYENVTWLPKTPPSVPVFAPGPRVILTAGS